MVEVEALAKVRGSAYEGLAFAFSPPSSEFPPILEENLLRPLQQLGAGFAWPALDGEILTALKGRGRAEGLEKRLTALKVEYHRLFVGPYQLPAPPYASVYLEPERTIMGPSTLEVVRRYEEAGFRLSPAFKEPPDHVMAELLFMACLALEEAETWGQGDVDGATTLLQREKAFLNDHLVRWVPRFAEQILVSTEEPFYQVLARLLRDFVVRDLGTMSALGTFLGEVKA